MNQSGSGPGVAGCGRLIALSVMDLFLVEQHSQTASLASGLLQLKPVPRSSGRLGRPSVSPVT